MTYLLKEPRSNYFFRFCERCGKRFKRIGKFSKFCEDCKKSAIHMKLSKELRDELNKFKIEKHETYESIIWRIINSEWPTKRHLKRSKKN